MTRNISDHNFSKDGKNTVSPRTTYNGSKDGKGSLAKKKSNLPEIDNEKLKFSPREKLRSSKLD